MSWKTFVRYGTDHDIETHVMHPGPIDNLPIMIEEEEEEEKEEEEEEENVLVRTASTPTRS